MRFLIVLSLMYVSCTSASLQENNSAKDSINKIEPVTKALIDSPNVLESKVQTIELEYMRWRCLCARWVTLSDKVKFASSLSEHGIYIEPADSSLNLPDNFDYAKSYIKVTGQFYIRKGFPKKVSGSEDLIDKGTIFRYTKIEIIRKGIISTE